ncbi:MAG: hypothetical protein H7Y17_03060 [Chlorobia bacterium]|nr:hypothetical protein [Fimbriimonadaceae bacterium]
MSDRDPNEGSIDPMEPEYWLLGEAIQDRILAAGYKQETVDGIAVDIHDLLQAADLIRTQLAPAILNASSDAELAQAVDRLKIEFHHLEWHGAAGQRYLESVLQQIQSKASA